MRKHFFSAFVALLALLIALPVQAQINTPSASVGAKLETTVGLTDVHVQYSRPSAKGRTIFAADGLVPFGKIWRTGANAATKVTFTDNVTIGGTELEGGSYAILSMPNANEWAFHFFPYESGSWSTYTEKEPVAKVMAKPQALNHHVETFTIDVNHVKMESAHLVFMWEKTAVAIPFEVKVKDRVMADIDRVLNGPSSNDYYAAGTFLHESGGDIKKALEYVQKANGMLEKPRFWQLRRESLLLAANGMKDKAIATAEKSLMLAKEAGNDDYIRMNEQSFKEWKGR